MSFLCQERQQRGPYATKACTNCRQKHAKCTGEAPCERCTRLNLVCIFNESGKKRGPKKNNKPPEEVYMSNYLRSDLDRTPMPLSVISNAVQGHASILSSPSGYPQQPYNIDEFTLYSGSYEEQNAAAYQVISPILYQAHTNTGYVIPNNDLTNNNGFADDDYYMLH
ncbi:hypothetical protein C2G38_2208529 [Gigaspora rosea]|uniref:Zn(2)-C6 fungal-type domain-containing protein n=1 Tax=Gigaspora rosea TaxID=44941 RepID=A0A397UR18_9GLOM|nr:hypothetical protein C2G38_2208529 [Gigaspora rosea]